MTLDQHIRAFLSERRLTGEEIEAVMKLIKTDFALGNVSWGATEADLNPLTLAACISVAREKVLKWMNKYRSNHPARALFTGES